MSQVLLPALNLKWDYSIATHIIERLPASETRDSRGMGLVLDYISLDSEMSNFAEGFSFVTISEESVFFKSHKPTRVCEDNKQLPWGITSKYFQSIGIFTMTAINGKGIAQL